MKPAWDTPEPTADGRFEHLFAVMPIASAIARAHDGCLLGANDAWLSLLGFTREDAIGRPTPSLNLWADPEDRARVGALLQAEGRVQDLEVPVRCRNGSVVDVLLSIESMSFGGEASLLFMMVNITARKQAERELEETRELFEALFRESPDAILLMDPHAEDINWKIVACNDVACTMNGYAPGELLGQSIRLLDPVDDLSPTATERQSQEAFMEKVRQCRNLHYESVHRRKDGTLYPVDISTTIVHVGGRELVLGIDRDITDRRAAEEQLKASQERLMLSEKLAGLGRLTAGLAHEINTPLASTMNSLREAELLTQEYLDSIGNAEVTDDDHREIGQELQSVLSQAGKTTSRIGEFIRTMRGHTRDTVTGTQEFDAVKLASETLLMIAHQARNAQIDLLLEQSKDPVLLQGEPSRFTQVLTNLVVNGIHACEDSGRPNGSVTVSFAVAHGKRVMHVQDTGTGISPEVLPRVFEPMFTTKEVGKGTGLGLSIIRDIVTGHFHGDIAVQTEPGEGTTFTVTF